MAPKFLIVLMTLMLCAILVFNAFGVKYSPNDFVGTMFTVENGLGKTADIALKTFDKAKEFVLSGADLLGSIYDATIGKLVAWIEDKFDLSLIDVLNSLLNSLLNFIRECSVYFEFFGRYCSRFCSRFGVR